MRKERGGEGRERGKAGNENLVERELGFEVGGFYTMAHLSGSCEIGQNDVGLEEPRLVCVLRSSYIIVT